MKKGPEHPDMTHRGKKAKKNKIERNTNLLTNNSQGEAQEKGGEKTKTGSGSQNNTQEDGKPWFVPSGIHKLPSTMSCNCKSCSYFGLGYFYSNPIARINVGDDSAKPQIS